MELKVQVERYKSVSAIKEDNLLEVLEELSKVLGANMGWELNASMAPMLHANGRAEEALEYSVKAIAQIPANHSERNKLKYDYAASLKSLGRMKEALDIAVTIGTARPYEKQIKTEIICMIAYKCIEEDNELK